MMKIFIALTTSVLLAACATTHANVYDSTPVELDGGTKNMLTWLKNNGYGDALITGRRLEDCGTSVAGYGILVKRFEEKSGKPVIMSAVVCEYEYGKYSIEFDGEDHG